MLNRKQMRRHARNGEQAALRRGVPIWLEGSARAPRQKYRALKGHHKAEVAVVGGGMTGALVAYQFANHGVDVRLVEAELVGRGSTAASSALLLKEPDRGLGDLTRRYGRQSAARIWRLSSAAVHEFVEFATRLGLRCDLVQRDAVYVARTTAAARSLRREFQLGIRSISPTRTVPVSDVL